MFFSSDTWIIQRLSIVWIAHINSLSTVNTSHRTPRDVRSLYVSIKCRTTRWGQSILAPHINQLMVTANSTDHVCSATICGESTHALLQIKYPPTPTDFTELRSACRGLFNLEQSLVGMKPHMNTKDPGVTLEHFTTATTRIVLMWCPALSHPV